MKKVGGGGGGRCGIYLDAFHGTTYSIDYMTRRRRDSCTLCLCRGGLRSNIANVTQVGPQSHQITQISPGKSPQASHPRQVTQATQMAQITEISPVTAQMF